MYNFKNAEDPHSTENAKLICPENEPMHSIPLVSIILPTFNRKDTIQRSVNSVLNQSFSDFELIIVDDASTDSTREMLKCIHDNRIEFITHSNQRGAGAARNTGIAKARGEYIAFQDSDDEWMQNKLKDQLMIINSNKNIGAVFSPYLLINNTDIEQKPSKIISGMQGNIFRNILGGSFVGTPTLLVRRSVFEKSGVFNEKLKTLEDWELVIRMAKCCHFACIKKFLLKAYATSESVSSNDQLMLQTVQEIIKIHRIDYDSYPQAEAKLWTSMGYRTCYSGKMNVGKNYFFKAIKLDMWKTSAWFGLVIALMGKKFFYGVVKIKRRISHFFKYFQSITISKTNSF